MGETFVIQMFERVEDFGIRELTQITSEIPEANDIILQEEEHENQLITLVDEERLKYVGAMVLGLNDALVELTGMIAGMTFAFVRNEDCSAHSSDYRSGRPRSPWPLPTTWQNGQNGAVPL
jgi:VIT1/CCC1 family predicted Fe2+/Mn2+ transporter